MNPFLATLSLPLPLSVNPPICSLSDYTTLHVIVCFVFHPIHLRVHTCIYVFICIALVELVWQF